VQSGDRQPDAPVPSRRRVLADVEPAQLDAPPLALAGAQFDTIRLRLLKLAVRIEVLKTQVRLHLPMATPDQAIFAMVLTRMPRLTI
jgi:hypothetical protein